jgi:hypothetical protein
MNVTEFIITSARSNNTKPKPKSFAQKMLYSPDTKKWIQENKIPKTLEPKIIDLCSFEGHDPELIQITHSTSNARRWKEVIKAIINHTISNNESGHDITTCFEDNEQISLKILLALTSAGFNIEEHFPWGLTEFLIYYAADEHSKLSINALITTPELSLLTDIIQSITIHHNFYQTLMGHLKLETGGEFDRHITSKIEKEIPSLAIAKLKKNKSLLLKFNKFWADTNKQYAERLSIATELAVNYDCAIDANFTSLLSEDCETLELFTAKITERDKLEPLPQTNKHSGNLNILIKQNLKSTNDICELLNINTEHITTPNINLQDANKLTNDATQITTHTKKLLDAIKQSLNKIQPSTIIIRTNIP